LKQVTSGKEEKILQKNPPVLPVSSSDFHGESRSQNIVSWKV